MSSKYADEYNHDGAAPGYDEDVLNEEDPIRTGYTATLDWVIEAAAVRSDSRVLELGSGTGNLTRRIGPCRKIVCVDVSEKMEAIAAAKLLHLQNRRFIQDDILHVLEEAIGEFDVILSTYTIHHLLEEEKAVLFARIWDRMAPGGKAVFGDLMLERAEDRQSKVEQYKSKGEHKTAEAIEEEFFWFLDSAERRLRKIGFDVTTKRFSDLSFGIRAQKPCRE